MDILLSLVALWQLQEIGKIEGIQKIKINFVLLLISFTIPPFFSYTFPIAEAPVLLLLIFSFFGKDKTGTVRSKKAIIIKLILLTVSFVSIFIFYRIDVSQLMSDTGMHNYWKFRSVSGDSFLFSTIKRIWELFAEVGTGFVFEIVFAVIGILSFMWNISEIWRIRFSKGKIEYKLETKNSVPEEFVIYSLLLALFVVFLVLTGKLPVEPKFNAFCVPAFSILIINFLVSIEKIKKFKVASNIICVVLFLAVSGNIFISMINMFIAPEYSKKIDIYKNTENAIEIAQKRNIPIFVTPELAYPDDIVHVAKYLTTVPASEILKTFPAYQVSAKIPVYSISSINVIDSIMRTLPSDINEVEVGNGTDYKIIIR